MFRDLNDSVNQSSFFSIFLKRISILFIFSPLIKNSLLTIVSSSISFWDKLNIFKAFKEDSGIIGLSKKLIFLTISKVV